MRYIHKELLETLQKDKKMAFIAGPRQVGKTTLAQSLLQDQKKYFNWDITTHKKNLLRDPLYFWQKEPPHLPCRIVLDEIHKYPRWKRFLKGFFDANKKEVEAIVTGSGRLDIFQKGGDSLFGRYHLFHLMPFTLGELLNKDKPPLSPKEALDSMLGPLKNSHDFFDALWNFNGFPEPLFSENTRKLTQWQNDHRQLVLKEDLRDLTQVRELGLIESLVFLLPERIGSPLSINSLREDLDVNFKTVQNWLSILSRLYFIFSIKPYHQKLGRALKKEDKVYFFDWSELEDPGKRFENFIAVHLLKACYYWTDAGYGSFTLHYVRDKEKREVDFLICNKNKPVILVEAKLSEKDLDKSLHYFTTRLPVKTAFQVIKNSSQGFLKKQGENMFLIDAERFLQSLP